MGLRAINNYTLQRTGARVARTAAAERERWADTATGRPSPTIGVEYRGGYESLA